MQSLRERILHVSATEFAAHGFQGARIERIAAAAGCSVRMLYKCHGDKQTLYTMVLERAYAALRQHDLRISTLEHDPVEAVTKLIDWTFDYMNLHREFVLLTRNENLLEGKILSLSQHLSDANKGLIRAVSRILQRGAKAGAFKAGIDPLQLYVSIVALSVHHIANEHTLSKAFQRRLGSPAWVRERREHVRTLILSGMLLPGTGNTTAT